MSSKIRSSRVVEPSSALIKITDVHRTYPSFMKGRKHDSIIQKAKEQGLSVFVVKRSLILLSRAEIIKGKSIPNLFGDLKIAFAKHRRFLNVGSLMEFANISESEATDLLSAIHLSFNRIGMEDIPCTELDLMLYLHLHNLSSYKGY